ncbi:MAG: hypothetical protein DDT40_01368 [candidate division WS2 bacterium]|nr:hypothetical protein [Candidatus Psychracetigena formicireducens]
MRREFVTIASGGNINILRAYDPGRKLETGTLVEFRMDLKLPLANRLATERGKRLFQGILHKINVTHIIAPTRSKIVIRGRVTDNPLLVGGLVAFMKLHWGAKVLLVFGIGALLGWLIYNIRILAEVAVEEVAEVFPNIALNTAVIVGIVLLAILIIGGTIETKHFQIKPAKV